MIAIKITEKTRLGYMTVAFNLSVEQGNQIAYEFSKKNKLTKAVYFQGKFWLIRHPNDQGKKIQKWQEQLNEIAINLQIKEGFLDLTIQKLDKVEHPEAHILAQLASHILRREVSQDIWKFFLDIDKQIAERINIYRYLKISPETFSNKAALIFDWRTSGKYPGTLKNYWLKSQKNNDILKGLNVENRFISGNNGIIEEIIGYCNDEQKAKLLNYPDIHSKTREIIENSSIDDPIVSVKTTHWGKESYAHYVIDGLNILINEDNSKYLGIDYEFYRSKTKISLHEWLELLIKAQRNSSQVLNEWGIEVEKKYVSSQNYSKNFDISKFNQDSVKLCFGNNTIVSRSQIKEGLKKGGVYRRHKDFQDLSNKIQVVILNLCKLKDDSFLRNLNSQLEIVKFPINFIEKIPLEIEGGMSEKDAVLIEKEIERIVALEPDLVITILPIGDKALDHTERGSYYYHTSHQLIPRGIASQMIKEENLNNNYIINNIVLGILAKLGNLPFILAEPLKVADYFIGLDVAHERKRKTGGTKNACACVRIYGASGQFIKYKLADSRIEGEEIPIEVIRKLLPFEDLFEKKVLIFRDGRFKGKEINFLKERAEAIGAKFIFVEITKTGACRLFNQLTLLDQEGKKNQITLQKPSQYLIFKHSEREATIATTKPLTGLVQPIRVTIAQDGEIPSLDDVLEAVIKLCLLHHGSYKEAGIPMPIYSSDKIGYKTLKGLYHLEREGEKQWWH